MLARTEGLGWVNGEGEGGMKEREVYGKALGQHMREEGEAGAPYFMQRTASYSVLW